jgi:aspartate aminotransferase-like enzyme
VVADYAGLRTGRTWTGKGFKSVAAVGFQASGVVVSYTDDADIKSGKKFVSQGLQIAAVVPLQCDEPADFQTLRIGLFGLEKLHSIERTVSPLEQALDEVMGN